MKSIAIHAVSMHYVVFPIEYWARILIGHVDRVALGFMTFTMKALLVKNDSKPGSFQVRGYGELRLRLSPQMRRVDSYSHLFSVPKI
ncbi:hypothetical protein [Candidatus Methanoperedens nitratireducens]|uniref:Uncharacterized protein n=1 Tax=Candidatus Methanoperedens nitratireducens TaxID=1392998 RepID=A0A284VJV6_9EURY|nr:hypothetical protein [Candidatus Methanoperedens nitroreducens]SNQ59522.1 hypothetical protein MNV_1210005 [Candidatus Methanoperedens nitroreducens]